MIILANPPYKVPVYREGRCQQRVGIFSSPYPPLTLAQIASSCEEAKIIDCINDRIDTPTFLEMLNKERPERVILSVSTPTIDSDLQLANKISTHTPVSLVGVHAEQFKDSIGYDVIEQPRADVIPRWDLVDLKKYVLPLSGWPFCLVNASSGCPYSCSFCINTEKKVFLRPIENLFEELNFLISSGIKDLIFFSDNFTYDKEWVSELCDAMRPLKMNWYCNSRVDTFDAAVAGKMKEAGLKMVSFGIESADKALLAKCGKGITPQQSMQAVRTAKKTGLLTFGHFVIGLEGDTEDTINNTIDFSLRLPLDFAAFYIATPFPGTPIYKGKKGEWEDYHYSRNHRFSQLQAKAYRRFYLRPRMVKHTLKHGWQSIHSAVRAVKTIFLKSY